jgi:hypothetical protein
VCCVNSNNVLAFLQFRNVVVILLVARVSMVRGLFHRQFVFIFCVPRFVYLSRAIDLAIVLMLWLCACHSNIWDPLKYISVTFNTITWYCYWSLLHSSISTQPEDSVHGKEACSIHNTPLSISRRILISKACSNVCLLIAMFVHLTIRISHTNQCLTNNWTYDTQQSLLKCNLFVQIKCKRLLRFPQGTADATEWYC